VECELLPYSYKVHCNIRETEYIHLSIFCTRQLFCLDRNPYT